MIVYSAWRRERLLGPSSRAVKVLVNFALMFFSLPNTKFLTGIYLLGLSSSILLGKPISFFIVAFSRINSDVVKFTLLNYATQ